MSVSNKEKQALRSRKHYELNKEKIKAKRKQRYYANTQAEKKKTKEWVLKNQDYVKQKRKEYREKNKDKISFKNKLYRIKNIERFKKYSRETYWNNKQENNAISRAYYARNKEETKKKLNMTRKQQKVEVISRYTANRNCCECCGESRIIFLCVDHILGGGGKHRKKIGNTYIYTWIVNNGFPKGLQILCMGCNSMKRKAICCPCVWGCGGIIKREQAENITTDDLKKYAFEM